MPVSALTQRINGSAINILGEYYNYFDVLTNFFLGNPMECLVKIKSYQLVESIKKSALSLEELSQRLSAIQQLIIDNDELIQPVLRFQIVVIEELRRALVDYRSLDLPTINDFFSAFKLLSVLDYQRGVFTFDEDSLLGLRKILLHNPQQSIPFMHQLFGDSFIPLLISAAYESVLLNSALNLMREASIDFNLLQCFQNQLNQQPLLIKIIDHAPERLNEVLGHLRRFPAEQREAILLSTYPNHYSGLLYKAIDKKQTSIFSLIFTSLCKLPPTPMLQQYIEKQFTLVLGTPFNKDNTDFLLDYLIQNNQLSWILQVLQLPLRFPRDTRLAIIATRSPLLFQQLLNYAEKNQDYRNQDVLFQILFDSAAQNPLAARRLIDFIVSHSACRERWCLMNTQRNQNILHIAAEHAPEDIQGLMDCCKIIIPHKFDQLMAQATQDRLYTPLLVAVEQQPSAVPFLLTEITQLDNAKKILLHLGHNKDRVFNAMNLADLCGCPATSQLICEAVKPILVPVSSANSSFFTQPSLAINFHSQDDLNQQIVESGL